jgi:serine phosphatase RsbU (regulator of sigma subunit)
MEYEQTPLRLIAGQMLTLLTDGVPEAQDAKKTLFGFTRVAALLATRPTADEIVEAACAFGQQDDITVVTMMRLARFAAVEMATLDLRETAAPA